MSLCCRIEETRICHVNWRSKEKIIIQCIKSKTADLGCKAVSVVSHVFIVWVSSLEKWQKVQKCDRQVKTLFLSMLGKVLLLW